MGIGKRKRERGCVRHRSAGGSPCGAEVAEVVDGHARGDEEDAVVAEAFEGLAQAVVLVRVFAVVQRDLHDGYG